MKIPNTTTDYRTGLDILCEQHQIRRECFFSGPGLIMGLTVPILIVMAAIVIPAVANVGPNAMTVADRLKGPSLKRPFGTDEFGRDLIIRVLYEARVSLLAGGTVTLSSCALDTVIGICASYFKTLDYILIHICEGLIAIPGVLLAVTLMAALGANNLNMIIALAIMCTPSVAWIMCSSALVAREQPYAKVAKVQGAGGGRIFRKLILPDIVSPLTVQASFVFAQAIIFETPLSLLGAGIPAPAASWGNILQGNKQVLQKTPWIVMLPGLAVVLCMLSLNLLGDGLRNYLDPRTAERKKR